VRLPNQRFHAEITEAIEPARDAQGMIDIAGTMQVITGIIKDWVREHPKQWLWLHRRWRPSSEGRSRQPRREPAGEPLNGPSSPSSTTG